VLLSIAPILPAVGPRKLEELPSWAAGLLEDGRVAHLGLHDDKDHPRVLPVTYALAEGRIWTAIDRKRKRAPEEEPARVRFLRRDPRAALTVDRYADDWEALAWVQVLGEVEIVAAADASTALSALVEKYPQYADSPPPGPLLALTPGRGLFWRAAEAGDD
jgi:PPOX class probable F420-dependent enzyme